MFRCLPILALGLAVLPIQNTRAAGWKAGTAKVIITPDTPLRMMGFAGRDEPAVGKLTDLWAEALAIEDDRGTRAVMITVDVSNTYRDLSDRVCRQLAQKRGLRRPSVAICASHTHCGPVVGHRAYFILNDQERRLKQQYDKKLERKLVDVAVQAVDNLAPARLSWGRGQADFAYNRMANRENEVPELRAQGKLKGPHDHDVPVLVVRDEDHRIKAVACGYACHASVLGGMKWSADWPGFARIEIQRRHPGATALVWAGCGGDQGAAPRMKLGFLTEYGGQIAQAVDDALAAGTQPIAGRLACTFAQIDLPWARIPTREELEEETHDENRYKVSRAKHLLELLDRDGRIEPTYPFPVQVWQLGSGPTFVFLGGETCIEYALRLKAELSPRTTWVAGYANDGMGYIGSARVIRHGGYQGADWAIYYGRPSPWKPGIEQQIIDEVHRQVEQINAGGAATSADEQ